MSRTYRGTARRNRSMRPTRGTKNRRWRRDRRVAPRQKVVRDTEAVFRAAILAGLLSAERSDRRWAGHYFYMFHDEDGTAWFKHRDTRAYLAFSQRREASARRQTEAGCDSERHGT